MTFPPTFPPKLVEGSFEKILAVALIKCMENIDCQENGKVEDWTEDDVFHFIKKHFVPEVATKFKGKHGCTFSSQSKADADQHSSKLSRPS